VLVKQAQGLLMIDARLERFTKTTPLDITTLTLKRAGFTRVNLAGENVDHLETWDFDTKDPWSVFKRQEIGIRRLAGWFNGQTVLEFGSGDGRNFREAGKDATRVIGVEKEEWRSAAAWHNLVNIEGRSPETVEIWTGCAVDYLTKLRDEKKKVNVRVIACLPQSPEGINTADKYDASFNIASYKADWDKAGLTLNAAALDNLRKVASAETRALVIISDRVLPKDQSRLFRETGWEIVAQAKTKDPVQQDPDTGVAYVQAYDDRERFWEKANGVFRPIDAVTAENRRLQSMQTQGRAALNVYHDLTEFEIRPLR